MRLIAAIPLVALLAITMSANSEGATSPRLPLKVPETAWRPLDQRGDQGLQAKLDQALKQDQLWRALIDRGKMALGLVDLSDPAWPRFAQVNGNTMMYAASLPKIAILLAAFQGFCRREPQRDPADSDRSDRDDPPLGQFRR